MFGQRRDRPGGRSALHARGLGNAAGDVSAPNSSITGPLPSSPGETTKTISIEVKGDSKKEADETFYLDLFGLSSNALFTKNRGIGTILNDD